MNSTTAGTRRGIATADADILGRRESSAGGIPVRTGPFATGEEHPAVCESYGYDARNPAPQANDPRRQNGTRSHARHDGTGEGTRTARQAYPQDGYQTGSYQTGEYPAGGYPAGDHQGNGYQRGSYPTGSPQGSGYPGGSHRAPYDPREDYRRLTQRL